MAPRTSSTSAAAGFFFTHHHFDHDVDYPCFLLCRWDQSIGRENRLQVFGPTLTERITERLIGERGAFTHDWQARVGHPLSQRVYRNRGGTVHGRRPHGPGRGCPAAHRIEVAAQHNDGAWKPTAKAAEERGAIHARRWVDRHAAR